MKMNLPNKLSVLRLIMVPIFMVVMLLPVFTEFSPTADTILTLVGAFLFIAASFTDMLDGKIARKYNLITDFGKFMDPIADKLTQLAVIICLCVKYPVVISIKNNSRSPRVKKPNKSCVSSRIISVTNNLVSVFSLPTSAE